MTDEQKLRLWTDAYAQGLADGSKNQDALVNALRKCMGGCGEAVDMFESATDPSAIENKAELQGYVNEAKKLLKSLEALKK